MWLHYDGGWDWSHLEGVFTCVSGSQCWLSLITQDRGWHHCLEHLPAVSVMPRLPLSMVAQFQRQLSQGRELSGRCIAFYDAALEATQLLPQSIC